jgi:hypothetical protein
MNKDNKCVIAFSIFFLVAGCFFLYSSLSVRDMAGYPTFGHRYGEPVDGWQFTAVGICCIIMALVGIYCIKRKK